MKPDGTVWAWGYNYYGQLGNNSTTNSSIPVQVSSLTGVVAIAGGTYHSLAVKSDGTVWAWGYNSYGELGNNSTTNSSIPVQVSGLSNVVIIAGGLALESEVASDSGGVIASHGRWDWKLLLKGSENQK